MTRRSNRDDIGRRLAAIRLDRRLSQASVARLAGIAPSYLSRIETGRVHPMLGTAARIASALRVSLDDLLGPGRDSGRRGACPISHNGICLMDLVRVSGRPRPEDGARVYTPAQLRLLRRFADLLQGGTPDVLRALDVLLGQIVESRGRRG